MYCDADDFSSWDRADFMADRAFQLYEDGQISQALTQLREAIGINPTNSAWHFNAGLAFDSMDDFENAIKAYKDALELCPDDPEILNCLAIDYTRTGRYDLAISTFEHIEQIAPDFEPCYCNRIITYTEMEQHDKAEQMFYLAQQIHSDCPLCFYNIGNSLFSRQQYDRAIWCWDRTALLEPTHPQINYRIAQAHWANGNAKLARDHFLHELRNDPGDTDVILDFGIFLLKEGQIDAAKEKFNRIIELTSDSAAAIFYLGESALQQNFMVEAQRYYRQAIEKDPEIGGPRYRLAQMAIDSGETEKAKELLCEELMLAVEDIDILLSISAMFIRIGATDCAIDTLLGIMDEDQKNATAFHYMGVAMAMQGEKEGAMHFLEHAVGLDDGNPEFLAETAAIYLENGCMEEASRCIRNAAKLDSAGVDIARLDKRIRHARICRDLRRCFASLPVVQHVRLLAGRCRTRFNRKIRTAGKH
jgi:tetratricopeptide (TPR) repeat protein